MRNVSILLLMVFISYSIVLYSQDSEPSPLRFNFIINGDSLTNQVLSSDYFPQKKFTLGVQWGGHSRMMKALNMDFHQAWQPRIGWNDSTALTLADPTDSMKYIWDGREFLNCRAFQFKPTLYIPTYKRGQFIVQVADTTKSVFGFSYVRDTNQILNNPNQTCYHLYKDSINYIDSVVLEKVWKDDNYEFISDIGSSINDPINGRHWTFSINLRRLNLNENANSDDTILTIRLPYRLKVNETTFSYDTIKFSTKPKYSFNDTIRLKYLEDRGFALNDTVTATQNFIAITNRMLPDNTFITNTGRQDMTINAVFVCENPILNNPTLKSSKDGLGIGNLDIQIKYHGKRDVGINYCRISTPYGYDLLVGKFDSLIHDRYQKHINVIQNGGYEVFGFYGRDEFNVEYFAEQRYKALLLNSTTISEGAGGDYPDHFKYYVEPMYIWTGSGHFREFIHAPYFRTAMDTIFSIQEYRLHQGTGYIGHRSQDTLHSSYETDMDGGNWWKGFRISSAPDTMQIYFERLLNESATQLRIEGTMYTKFYLYSNYLYDNKEWWSNNFPVGNWEIANNYARMGNARPHTGEEVRWLLWSNLLMGSKGFMYDARCDSLFFLNDTVRSKNATVGFMYNVPQLNKFNTLPLDSLVFSNDPALGVDFIPEIDTASYIHRYINRDSTAKYLGVPKDRIYYGRKSPKIEMYKTHSWIRANDSLLMDLRLISAFSKGFRIWRSADTARFSDTIMNKFVKLDNRMIIFDPNNTSKTIPSDFGIKTRPINRTQNGENFYESYDSSFVDLTLMRSHADTTLTSKSIFVGLLNRRTDPLIYYDTTGMQPENKYMRFLSTAEFQDSCTNNPTWWNQWWWRRLGSRELAIPLNLPNIAYGDGAYLQAKEIGLDKMDSLGVWFDEPYYHRIDTIIPNNGVLISKHLPGQGKIIELKKINLFDDTCNICDVVNDFELINFRVHKYYSDPPNCCYEIILEKESSCPFDAVPIKIITSGIETPEFNSAPMTDSTTNIKYQDLEISTATNGSYPLGNLCVNSTEPATLEIVFGSNISELFYGCNRKFSFNLDCESLIDSASNCCDNIDSLDEVHYRDSILQLCCTDVFLYPNDSIHCVYGIDFNISGSEQLNYVKKDTIPLQFGLSPELIFTYCGIFVNCIPPATESSFIQRKVKLRGKDDEIICEYTVDIMICCDIISDPGDPSDPNNLGGGLIKGSSNRNNETVVPQFSVIPNPTDGNLQLQINNLAKEIIDINIINQDSQVLKTFSNIQINNQIEEINLNIYALPAGAYIVHISNSNINLSTKIIKLK